MISCPVFARLCLLRAKAVVAVTCLAFVYFSGTAPAKAQSNSSAKPYTIDENFTRGWHEATVGFDIMLSPGYFSAKHRPTVNYSSGFAEAGYMLYDVSGEGSWRGNVELAPELFASGIWGNTGNYITGWTLWTRYNFVPRNSKVVPYLQLGAGTVLTDIDHRYDGQDFNFNLGLALGFRYFIKPRLSLNAEYRYQHISNANTARRNIGINATGPVFGISWFF